MKFTLSWLKDFLDTNASGQEICDTLNKIGLEVDNFEDYTIKYRDFNCAFVEECTNHPDSDHLHICKVKTKDKILNIICGAPNVKTGMKVLLAPVGSILPNGLEIKKSKIRGIESCGMLCSEKELGIGEDYDGIIELDNSIEIGTNLANIYNLNDSIFEISITPNRNDCLCVYGIARDLSSAGIGKLKEIKQPVINESFESQIKLNISDDNCKVFSFREIHNIKNQESPQWLKNKLLSIGINPKNVLVDVGNYVMFCFNTPLHCYDRDKIDNEIILYAAKDNEEFTDLFGNKYLLKEGNTVIADKNKKICLAGIIGSSSSLSSLETKNVIIECAIFDPINTAKTGRQLNIITDSRYRFERGSDYNMIQFALDYATYLIESICGGEASKTNRYENKNYKNSITKKINLPIQKIENILGLKIEDNIIKNILLNSGYKFTEKNNILNIDVPTWKNSIVVKEDIIDDIIKFYGYDHLNNDDFNKIEKFEKEGNCFTKNLLDKLYMVRKKLVANSITEIISYAFTKREDNELFCKTNDNLELLNPIISDLSYMRQSILVNLLNMVKKNNNRGFENLSFFEIGNLFKTNDANNEELVIGGVRTGSNNEKNIYNDTRKFDIFDVKSDLFDVLNVFGINCEKLTINKNVPNYYHPNRSGALIMGNIVLGYFGELHPKVQKEFGLKQKIMIFELFVDNLPKKIISENSSARSFIVNDLQPVERSFAFIINSDTEVGEIIKNIYSVDKDFITQVKLFDIYQNELCSLEKSIAFKVTIQPKNETLTKEIIDTISDKIIDLVGTKYKGKLRDGK